MFSATMPPVIAQLAREILRNPLAALPVPGPKATPGC
jgi:hypothetical protein